MQLDPLHLIKLFIEIFNFFVVMKQIKTSEELVYHPDGIGDLTLLCKNFYTRTSMYHYPSCRVICKYLELAIRVQFYFLLKLASSELSIHRLCRKIIGQKFLKNSLVLAFLDFLLDI